MNLRSKKMTALLLSASLVFSFNSAAFAEEVEISETDGVIMYEAGEAEAEIYEEAAEVDDAAPATPVDAAHALSGNVTIKCGAPNVKVSVDNIVTVSDINLAIVDELSFEIDKKSYRVDKDTLIDNENNAVIEKGVVDKVDISLNKIRSAGALVSDAKDIKYKDDSKKVIADAHGNQVISFTAGINKTKIPGAKFDIITGEILLKDAFSGSVSQQRVYFGKDKKYAVVIKYDGAVEYRGSNVSATSHYYSTSEDGVSGDVDGAVGVSAGFYKVSSNGELIPLMLDKDNKSPYFWKDDTGITLKKPKIYNAKTVGGRNDGSTAPYFTIKMSYSKKKTENDVLEISDKADMKRELEKTKFYFTVEPRRISTELITYQKNVPNKYYVNKLTVNTTKNTLKGNIQFRGSKYNKSNLNVRKLTNVGKKLNVISKPDFESNGKNVKKADAYFVYDSSDKTVTLTGIKGYYGTAVINDKITVK